MEKIFDTTVVGYLEDTGVSNAEIRRLQFVCLKTKAYERLNQIAQLLKDDKFEEIKRYLAHSPAGDGYGIDTDYIGFEFITGIEDMDIWQVCEMLIQLKPKPNTDI